MASSPLNTAHLGTSPDQEEQAKEICELYSPLDEYGLSQYCPLDNGRHTLKPEFGLGALAVIPLELLFNILVPLDLKTLTDFRRVNQRAMEAVDAIPPYKAIVQHTPTFLRAILTLKTGSWITCQLLVTCKRLCFKCYQDRHHRFTPITCSEAWLNFGILADNRLDWDNYITIPHLQVPKRFGATYRDMEIVQSSRYLDRESARMVGIQTISAWASWFSEEEGRPSRCLKIHQFQDLHDHECLRYRCLPTIRAPWWNQNEKTLEYGFFCRACLRDFPDCWGGWPNMRLYTAATFKDHIKEYGEVRKYHGRAPPWDVRHDDGAWEQDDGDTWNQSAEGFLGHD